MKDVLRSRQTAFEHYLAQFCAPIGWLPSLEAPSMSLRAKTATCALVDTGNIRAFVTCEHVWAEWELFREKNSEAVLLVGLGDGVPLILTNPDLVDSNEAWDIAVIRADHHSREFQTKAFYPIDEWPINQPKVGDVVAIIGFSASVRTFSAGSVTGWGIGFLGCRVSSVRSDKITLAPENDDRESSDGNWNAIQHTDIGGMSGSPTFLLKKNGKPALIGFLYEGKTSDNFIFVTPAHFIQANGKLRDRSTRELDSS